MSRYDNTPTSIAVIYLLLVLAGLVGWVMNVLAIWTAAHEASPNLLLAGIRVVGVFVFPIGAVIGWF